MNTSPSMASAVPAHVPAELVRDINPLEIPGAEKDAHLAWKQVKESTPDLYFTTQFGGFWVINKASLLTEVWPDYERFCSSGPGGISVIPTPPGSPPQLPITADPPLHRFYRQPISVAVSPRRVADLNNEMRALAVELIDGFKTKGQCEFVQEFSMHLPMIVFLRLVNLPLSDRAWLVSRAETGLRGTDPATKGRAHQEIAGYLDNVVRQRMKEPGNDLISDICRIQVDGRPITHFEALGESVISLFGGLDTVAGTMGFFMRFLAENPGHRQQLLDDPSLIPAAVEELLRRHSIPMVLRTVTQDLTLGGVAMKAGDRVILETALHGLDEQAWPDALTVDFNRDAREHMAFGRGVHKCPGANLARAELRILLEEWLARIPHFSTRPEDPPVTASGTVLGMVRLPLIWPVA